MARFRKIDPRYWKDEKIISLTPTEKLIALYLFTGQSNRIGIFNFSPGEAAEDLSLSLETFREGFGKVCQGLSFGWDETFRVLYLPTWWKYNCPENPNVLKACLVDLHEIPKTHLINEFSTNLLHLPETFHPTFREGLPKPSPKRMPDQEQEQKQKPKQKQDKDNTSPHPADEWPSPTALFNLYNSRSPDECPAIEKISQARIIKAKKFLAQFPKQEFWEEVVCG